MCDHVSEERSKFGMTNSIASGFLWAIGKNA